MKRWRGVIWVVECHDKYGLWPVSVDATRSDARENLRRERSIHPGASLRIVRYLRAPWKDDRKARFEAERKGAAK